MCSNIIMWSQADRLSDALVNTLNAEMTREIESNTLHSGSLLCGFLLAFCALRKTLPPIAPNTMDELVRIVHTILDEHIAEYPKEH